MKKYKRQRQLISCNESVRISLESGGQPASFIIKHRSEELIVFFITLTEELAESMPFKICAVEFVLSLESRKMQCLTRERL